MNYRLLSKFFWIEWIIITVINPWLIQQHKYIIQFDLKIIEYNKFLIRNAFFNGNRAFFSQLVYIAIDEYNTWLEWYEVQTKSMGKKRTGSQEVQSLQKVHKFLLLISFKRGTYKTFL